MCYKIGGRGGGKSSRTDTFFLENWEKFDKWYPKTGDLAKMRVRDVAKYFCVSK